MEDDSKAFWDRTAARYDRSMRLFGGPLPRMLELVAAEVSGARRVLELAAGTGLVTAVIAPVVGELLATDYAEAMVSRVTQRARALGLTNVTTRVLDVYAMTELPGSFDAVVAANVLHLLPDADNALDAMANVLVPQGRLVVPTFCHDDSWVSRGVSRALGLFGFPGRRRLTVAGLAAMVARHGFAVTRQERIAGLLPIGFVGAVRQ